MRKTEEHTASKIRTRYEKDEQQSEKTVKDCQGQRWMQNVGGWPMLLYEG